MPGQNFLSDSAGGLFTNNTLSKKLRAVAQPLMRFRQFTDKETQYGKRSGDTLLFDKILNVDASAAAGAVIAEGSPIPRTGFSIVQGTAIAKPSGVAVPWTEELESFSEFDVRSPIESRLVDHMAKSLDYRAYEEFKATKVSYTPTGSTGTGGVWDTDGVPSTAAARPVEVYDLKNVIDGLKKGVYNTDVSSPVPPYDGVNYMCIGSVDFCRALKDDPAWEQAQYYGDPEKLFSGETGRIYGCRVIEDNHILGKLGDSGHGGEAFFFGAEAVMEIVTTAEEIRVGIPGDFGRDMAMAWYYLGGFKVIWEYNATTQPDNRIVHVTATG